MQDELASQPKDTAGRLFSEATKNHIGRRGDNLLKSQTTGKCVHARSHTLTVQEGEQVYQT